MTEELEPGRAYWLVIDSMWDNVSIYDGADEYLSGFHKFPSGVGHLFAAHWCQSEVRNGGLRQFFHNSTGVLAPEAKLGFEEIGLGRAASILDQAMNFFGSPYPRDRQLRVVRLNEHLRENPQDPDPFLQLDDQLLEELVGDGDRFAEFADKYASSLAA